MHSSETARESFITMLHGTGRFPGDVMKKDPGQDHEADGDEAHEHPNEAQVIKSRNDVVHVSHKTCDGNQPHMDR